MSGEDSSTFSDARAYRFISDPGHKENLSGRVRAACLTCRRKKINCSGELNCRTCRDRGIVCEGFPERKRPRKETRNTPNPDLASRVGIDRKRRINPSKRRNASQTVALSTLGESSDDTGRLDQNASGSLQDASIVSDFDSPFDPGVASRKTFVNTSRRNSLPAQTHTETCIYSKSSHVNLHMSPNGEPQLPLEERSWWFGAGGEFIAMSPEARTRRQTVASLFPTPETTGPHYDTRSNVHGIFDDTSLLVDHAQGTGLTPGEFSSWLNTNVHDLPPMLHPPPAATTNAFDMSHQPPGEYSAGPLTQVAQTQAETIEDYFNQGWPK